MAYEKPDLQVLEEFKSKSPDYSCMDDEDDNDFDTGHPIPQPDPVHNIEETHDLVLKTKLEEKRECLEQGPMIEQLSKMFFTTKHRWYPHGL
ncbi:39S ribosomal protein L42, mitochondrial [Fukomys damarensis]|uniref:Large ribosomal subunit protein mL42 n=1 Tax=Fukomys damarensis TaxID=885580 RepID=A0A091DJC0_FUKDA|nr:39S ribosomal protein L42, mitochondrial [Fukomys damarensis]